MALLFTSCETKVGDSDYPEQKIYLPAAVVNRVYVIDQAYLDSGSTPTEGAPFQFVADYDNATFSIPLSVYRSGVTKDGDVNVSVWLDDTIIYQMYEEDILDENSVTILDMDLMQCTDHVRIRSGEDRAAFNVVIDLDYLLDQSRFKKKFAFAVTISSEDRKITEGYDTVVIVVDTQLFENL